MFKIKFKYMPLSPVKRYKDNKGCLSLTLSKSWKFKKKCYVPSFFFWERESPHSKKVYSKIRF